MKPERWQLVNRIFREAATLDDAERHNLLAERCAHDQGLRAEVERMLAADAGGDRRQLGDGQAATRIVDHSTVHRSAALEIPGYDILREIHRGGQGVVYQAVQQSTKRKVAIKVLLDGHFASASAKRRFEREIELAASLTHPNIVTVFHSGVTNDARQYYVMDYVRGVPLTRFVRDRRLSLDETVSLFAIVCDAVGDAHRNGIIHRDLKPANILVDAAGQPHVLDFGLARSIGGPERTLATVTGQAVGTLQYMSPEQVRGNPDEIDSRADVYSLGVTIFECLTGRLPYSFEGGVGDWLKHICDTDSMPPSRVWEESNGVTPTRNGVCPINYEIDTMCLKALNKSAQRRYQGAEELAIDLRHYLEGEPIAAKRDSSWYLFKSSVRRRRPLILTCLVLIIVILANITISGVVYQNEQTRLKAAIDDYIDGFGNDGLDPTEETMVQFIQYVHDHVDRPSEPRQSKREWSRR